MFTFAISEKPIADLETHTLYSATSAVNSLPLRRVLTSQGTLRELVILLNDLRPESDATLIRVKHVAVDFTRDFRGRPGVVPGLRIVGKLSAKVQHADRLRSFELQEKVFVFPHLACWIQGTDLPCNNCIALAALDISHYSSHKKYPCTGHWVYGVTIDGGLQDYMRIPQALHTLIKIPPSVSLHDCCFLLDVALPFYTYCQDVLCDILEVAPNGRVLVILDDSRRDANDCLLVIHLLQLNHQLLTFTDMRKLLDSQLADTYEGKFDHVLVFSQRPGAVDAAKRAGVSTGLESTKSRYTIALYGDHKSFVLPDRTVHKVQLTYKDKFLMQELLSTLSDINRNRTGKQMVPSENDDFEMQTSLASETHSVISLDARKRRILFKNEDEVVPAPERTHVSWLHCDEDFRLCSDDHCDHAMSKRCQSTSSINSMLLDKNKVRRVFYTNRPASHVKINAFIF